MGQNLIEMGELSKLELENDLSDPEEVLLRNRMGRIFRLIDRVIAEKKEEIDGLNAYNSVVDVDEAQQELLTIANKELAQAQDLRHWIANVLQLHINKEDKK